MSEEYKYERVNWQNYKRGQTPLTGTPLNAENLNIMDEGIEKAHERIDNINVTVNPGSSAPMYKDCIYTEDNVPSIVFTEEELNQLKNDFGTVVQLQTEEGVCLPLVSVYPSISMENRDTPLMLCCKIIDMDMWYKFKPTDNPLVFVIDVTDMTSPFETPVQANSHMVACNLQEFTDNAPFFSINTVLDVLEPGITSDIDDRPVVLINGDQDTIENIKMEMKMYGWTSLPASYYPMSTASFAASQDIYNGYPVYERYPQVVLTEDLEDSDLAMAIRNGECTVDVTGYVPSSGSSYTVLTYRGSYNGIDYVLEARPLFKVVGNSSTRTYLYVLFVKTATHGTVYYYSGDTDSLEDFNNVVSNRYTHVCFKDSGPMRILSQSDNLYTLSAALDFIGGPIDADELDHYNGYMTYCIQMYRSQDTITQTRYYSLLNTVLPNIKVGDENTSGCISGGTLESLLINDTVYSIHGDTKVNIAKYRLHLDTNTFVDFYLTSILDDEHLQTSPIAYSVLQSYFLAGYIYGLTLTEVKEGSSDSPSLAWMGSCEWYAGEDGDIVLRWNSSENKTFALKGNGNTAAYYSIEKRGNIV